MWWRRCSLSHPRRCTMPAGSSERESRRPRQDKVSEMTQEMSFFVYIMGICRHLHLHFFLCFSVRLWPLPVWRWSQERNLAGVWKDLGLLHAAKWSKIKSYSLGRGTVSVWILISLSDLKFPGPVYSCVYASLACWERLQLNVQKDQINGVTLLPLLFFFCFVLFCFFRMFWSTRRNRGHRRSKCWTARSKPSWWTTRRRSGSCSSPSAAESVRLHERLLIWIMSSRRPRLELFIIGFIFSPRHTTWLHTLLYVTVQLRAMKFIFKQPHLLSTLARWCTLDKTLITFLFRALWAWFIKLKQAGF